MKSLANLKAGGQSVLAGLTEEHIMNGQRQISLMNFNNSLADTHNPPGFRALDKQLGKNPRLNKEKRQIRIICSGGACAVAYLRTRPTTKDIDFYTPSPEDSREITYARYELDMYDSRSRARYPDGWINCEMGAHVNNLRGADVLFANSVKHGPVLFKGEYFVVYAADWKFQFVGKVKRAFDNLEYAQEEGKTANLDADKDFKDAIAFLHQILLSRRSPLTLANIKTWYNYGYFVTHEMVKMVNACYARRYRDDAMRFEQGLVIAI